MSVSFRWLLVILLAVMFAVQARYATRGLVAEARMTTGASAMSAGHPEIALGYFERAYGLDRHDLNLLYLLGNARREMGDLPGAATAFAEGLRIAPNDPSTLVAQAEVLASLGVLERAAALSAQVLAEVPHGWHAEHVAGIVSGQRGDHGAAAAHFQRSIDLAGTSDPRVRSQLAQAQYFEQEFTRALGNVDAALKHRPLIPDHHLIRGKILLALHEPDEAAKALGWAERGYGRRLEDGLPVQARLDETRRYFVRVQLARNRLARAAGSFAELAESVGASEEMLGLAAEMSARLDTLNAMADAGAQRDLGRALAALGLHSEADAAFERAMRAASDLERGGIVVLRAGAMVDSDRSGDAVALLEAARDTGERDVALHVALADALVAAGKTASAELEYLGVLRRDDLSDAVRAEVSAK